MMDINSISARAIIFSAVIGLFTHSASAKWTVTTEGATDYCTHVISDGNWKIGVSKIAEGNWRLGAPNSRDGSRYYAGEGVLDLRTLEDDCGVCLKSSSNGALERVTTITEVFLPDSLETIDGATFNNDKTSSSASITNVVLGSGIKTIGTKAFYKCTKLKTINFPEGLTTIGDEAFVGCSSLVLPAGGFPESLTTLGNKAFQECTSLPEFLDLKNVSILTGSAHFEGCKSIKNVYAPAVTSVPNYMFNKCSGLTNAVFSANLSSIGAYAFSNGGALVSFYPTTMPKLASIGGEAFRGQKQLAVSFDFSKSSITTIPTFALVDLHKVYEMRFPETLASLASASLAYNNGQRRVVWFLGPPPTMLNDNNNAMYPNSTSARWVLVAGKKHAAEWKADTRLLPLEEGDTNMNDFPGKDSVKAELGLQGTKPIGKWQAGTNGATFWVVEELASGFVLIVR